VIFTFSNPVFKTRAFKFEMKKKELRPKLGQKKFHDIKTVFQKATKVFVTLNLPQPPSR